MARPNSLLSITAFCFIFPILTGCYSVRYSRLSPCKETIAKRKILFMPVRGMSDPESETIFREIQRIFARDRITCHFFLHEEYGLGAQGVSLHSPTFATDIKKGGFDFLLDMEILDRSRNPGVWEYYTPSEVQARLVSPGSPGATSLAETTKFAVLSANLVSAVEGRSIYRSQVKTTLKPVSRRTRHGGEVEVNLQSLAFAVTVSAKRATKKIIGHCAGTIDEREQQ